MYLVFLVTYIAYLIAKHLTADLHQSSQIVITTTNTIKKNALNDRMFQQLCHNNDQIYKRLLHTEVRWPSKGNSLKRFHELFDSIVEFLEEYHSTLVEKVKRVRIDVAYLADIFEKLNTMNLLLQGNNNTNLIQAHGIVLSFLSKLTIFRQNIARREFGHLPACANWM